MSSSIAQSIDGVPVLRPDGRARMAKASVRKADKPHAVMGRIVADVRRLSGLNLDEFAREIKRNSRQVYRWEDGTDRPQIEAIFAVDEFKPLVVEAMACQSGHAVERETVIRIRRTA